MRSDDSTMYIPRVTVPDDEPWNPPHPYPLPRKPKKRSSFRRHMIYVWLTMEAGLLLLCAPFWWLGFTTNDAGYFNPAIGISIAAWLWFIIFGVITFFGWDDTE